MKVKMKTTVSGTESFYRAGDTYDLPEAHARRLIAVDYAEAAEAESRQSPEGAAADAAKKEKR